MSPSPLCGGIVVFEFYPRKNRCKIAWARVGCVLGVSCFPLGCSGWLLGVHRGVSWVSSRRPGCPLGGPRASPRASLASPGRPWGASGKLLGASGALWGLPGRPLGASWAPLSVSLVAPGCLLYASGWLLGVFGCLLGALHACIGLLQRRRSSTKCSVFTT